MAETFGKTTKGAEEAELTWAAIWGCRFESGSAGELASITLYIKSISDLPMKCAIYDMASKSLLINGTTEEKAITSSQDGWVTFNFPIRPTVEAETNYWLCWWFDDNSVYCYRDAGTTSQTVRKYPISYDGWPANLYPSEYYALEYSIYATYYEAPPPPAVKTLVQAALISIPPLIVLPTLREILRFTGGC